MEEKPVILCDTDVIIEFYRNNSKIVRELKHIGQERLSISIITYAELIYGAFNKREQIQIKKDISSLNLIMIDLPISLEFMKLMERYSLGHKISVPDALIAATAIENKLKLFTLNNKDFRYIEGLALYHHDS